MQFWRNAHADMHSFHDIMFLNQQRSKSLQIQIQSVQESLIRQPDFC